jgi:hypothetical protein
MTTDRFQTLLRYMLTVLLLLFGYVVLLFGIDAMHMRPDEYLTFRNMQWGFQESMVELATRNNQAPLWWMNSWVWQQIAGKTEFAGRVNSVLLSMLTLSLVYRIGHDWFGKPRYGWFALLLLSVNAYFFIYALEMRMYALTLLTTTLSMRFFYAWLSKRGWQQALMYGLSAALMLYVHYYLAFVIITQALYFALFHLLDWRLIKQGLAAAGLALLAWLPGILILVGQLQFIDFGGAGGLKIPVEETSLLNIIKLAQLATSGLAWVYLPLALVGLVLLRRKPGYRLALAWLFLSPVLVLLLNTQMSVYTVRYTSYVAPAVAITVGAAIAALPFRARWGVLIGLFAVSLIGVPDSVTEECYPNVDTPTCLFGAVGLRHYIPERIAYRDIFEDVSQQYQPGDALYVYHPGPQDILRDQFRRYLPPGLLANEVETVDTARDERRVWMLHNVWFTDDVRETFNQLTETHRVAHVSGECTRHWCYLAQLLEAPPRADAVSFGDVLEFRGATVGSIQNDALPVRLWWQVPDTPERDYAISLQLLDANGALIAQVDRQIQPPGIDAPIPTSQMQPGNFYLDDRVLTLPEDITENPPPAPYHLHLVVYQWWDGTRLTVRDDQDALPLQTLTQQAMPDTIRGDD